MKTILFFLLVLLSACGKSSNNNLYFPTPPLAPDADPNVNNPSISDTAQRFTFANQDPSTTRSNITYRFNQTAQIQLPVAISTYNNSGASNTIVLNFKNFTCTFNKVAGVYVNRDCLNVLALTNSDYLYVEGMPFGMTLSVNILFK